jgi:hypothetical protein
MNQLRSIIKAKDYLLNFNKKSSIKNNSIFYFATFVGSIGFYIFDRIAKKKNDFFKNFIMILKDVFYTYNFTGCEIYFSDKILNNYDNIYLTWASYSNFKNDGSLNDKYLNINSKDLVKTLIIAIYKDEKLPLKLNDNILIFQTKKNKIGFIEIIKNIFKNLNYIIFNYYFFLAKISSHNFFSEILLKKTRFLLNKKIKFFLTPYEGQPFQNQFIMQLKKINKEIKCIGYIHSPPIPIPSNYINKKYSPDFIILNGKDQKTCFNKFLGWPKSKIKLLPSFRFLKSKKNKKRVIFLPYNIINVNKIINSLNYIIENNIINHEEYVIRSHPAIKSRNSGKIINHFNKLKKKNNSSNEIKSHFLIFIGNSGGIIEYLERGYRVIHILDDDFYDFYSNELWPSIISTKLCNGIYIYKIKKKGNLIKLGDSKKHSIKKIMKFCDKL